MTVQVVIMTAICLAFGALIGLAARPAAAGMGRSVSPRHAGPGWKVCMMLCTARSEPLQGGLRPPAASLRAQDRWSKPALRWLI